MIRNDAQPFAPSGSTFHGRFACVSLRYFSVACEFDLFGQAQDKVGVIFLPSVNGHLIETRAPLQKAWQPL